MGFMKLTAQVHSFACGSCDSIKSLETTLTSMSYPEDNRYMVARALGKIFYNHILVLFIQKWFISELCKDPRHILSH